MNLPTTPAARPPVAPIIPPRPTPPAPAPTPEPVPVTIPGISVIPQPKSPPPAPKEAPVAPMPAIPLPPPPPPPPTPPKPVVIAPPPAPKPVAPVIPPKAPQPVSPQEGYSAELRTMSADIGNIKVGQAPAGIKQPTPSAPTAPAGSVAPVAAQKIPTIVIPEAGSSGRGGSRKMIYGVIGAIILIGITYALVSMLGSGSTPTASVSPSPSGSPAPTLGSGKNLRSYFSQTGPTITLAWDDTARPDLLNAIATSNPVSKQALRLGLTVPWPNTTAFGFLDAMTGVAPAALAQAMGTDWVALSYGQQEQYDANGIKIENTATSPKLILVTEVKDATAVNQIMTTWESVSLASGADILFSYDFTKAIVGSFSSGTYRQIPVRYWNFPYADRSIDYAIVTASNNKNYLVLSGSREAAFFAIDQLMQ